MPKETHNDPSTAADPGVEPVETVARAAGSVPWGRRLLEWGRAVILAFTLFIGIRAFGVEAFKIPTASMEGTLLVGDFLLVNKAVYGNPIPGTTLRIPGFQEPERGDVVVFHPPHDPARNYVKRLVGVPGDTLEMRDKVLFLNGEAVDEPWARHVDRVGDTHHDSMEWQENHLVAQPRRYFPSRDSWGPIVVPERRYFVLGDNRDNSEDSRYWGFVWRNSIRGRPWRVYYSFDPEPSSAIDWLTRVRWNRVGHEIQ